LHLPRTQSGDIDTPAVSDSNRVLARGLTYMPAPGARRIDPDIQTVLTGDLARYLEWVSEKNAPDDPWLTLRKAATRRFI